MALARYKDLCLDVVADQHDAMVSFYAAATGLTPEGSADDSRLSGRVDAQRIWVNVVPEARDAKNRVHLDVLTPSIADLESAGGVRLPDYPNDRWTVLGDPEGGEVCGFVADDPSPYRVSAVGVDSRDPAAISQWWADVFGAQAVQAEPDGWSLTGATDLPFASMDFFAVLEPKTVRNRIHWDIAVDEPEALAELERRGARRLEGYPTDRWTVMADPEGNEFCVFVA